MPTQTTGSSQSSQEPVKKSSALTPSSLAAKNFGQTKEVREFENGKVEIIDFEDRVVGPSTFSYVYAEGTINFRGTLGVDKNTPVGLTDILLTFDIRDNIPPEQKERLVNLAEKYCVIYQTLKAPPKLKTSVLGNS